MAVGAVYTIIANQGKMDNLLTANKFLKMRISQIVCAKKKLAAGNPDADVLPTLNDIEKTHILFVNAKYKPFVTTAMEYYKQTLGSPVSYGAQAIQLQIPQFGDFFADMAIRTTLTDISTTVGTVPAMPDKIGTLDGLAIADTNVQTSYNQAGIPAPGGVVTRYLQRYENFAGVSQTPLTGAASNFVRFCEYPGVRMFSETRFEVASAILDKYTSLAAITVAKKSIQPNKINAWKKLVGQEVPIESYTELVALAGQNGYQGPMGTGAIVSRFGAPDPANDALSTATYKQSKQYLSGLQTPQASFTGVQLWTPLWFWFNTDVHLAIPSAAIPFNNRFIKFNVAAKADILSVAPGNLFYRVDVEQFTTSTGAFDGVLQTVQNVATRRVPVLATNSTINGGEISEVALYINNLFIDPDVHEMYIRRIGFSMIRVFLEQDEDVNSSKKDILMQMLKYPVEFFFVGGLPKANLGATNNWRDWHRYQAVTIDQIDQIATTNGYVWDVAAGTIATAHPWHAQRQVGTDNVINGASTINTLKVYVSGVDLYQEEVEKFYLNYLTYNFGCDTINTQVDDGILFVNFSLFPWIYQPSGHFNVSRTNQFYVSVTSNYANTSGNVMTVKFVAKAINFLLIADGSCVLRYTA